MPDYASNGIGHQMIMGYPKCYRAISIARHAGFEGINNALRLSEGQCVSKTGPVLAAIHIGSVDGVNARSALREVSQLASEGVSVTGYTDRGADGLGRKKSTPASWRRCESELWIGFGAADLWKSIRHSHSSLHRRDVPGIAADGQGCRP